MSTRLIGALVMTHSDDKGLVLPPRVAPIQVVIVPIINKASDEDIARLNQRIDDISKALKSKGIRIKVDDRDNMRPGAKYFEWERKGLPLRLDIGLRDVDSNTAVLACRNDGSKETVSTNTETIGNLIGLKLDEIHDNLLKAATKRLQEKTFRLSSYQEMKKMIEKGVNGSLEDAGFYLVPWKCNTANEEAIKEDCKATIRCYPLEYNKDPIAADVKCFYSGEPATHYAIFARAF